ncbi:MAG: cell division protein FtsZ [Betaproteobacteria bacterium]|nr:cell division protein FtsZ [Betaproteobacteria bacterium]MDE2047708.1 cell division protein FtsZ [Betaproteobacteria bacterium]
MPFEMVEDQFQKGTNIKVIGVGGCGGNAVEHMINAGVQGVHFIAANTDAQSLSQSRAHTHLQLGQTGLGAGSKPEAGRLAAEAAEAQVREALEGANMLFITAGMGGGTGTGAGPVVARIAKEMGVLTVGVVTKPFEYEGSQRMKNAQSGLDELERHVDSLIVVLNEKLFEVYGDDITFDDALAHGNDVLKNAVGGIAEIINVPGLINVDFEDVKTVMSEPGKALMGTGVASGPDRARLAAQQAVVCPLLEGVELSGARGVLVNITATRGSLKASETRTAMAEIRNYASADAHVIFGTAFDESMGDQLRVTVVATGLNRPSANKRDVQQPFTVVRTGTDNMPVGMMPTPGTVPNYEGLETPTVWRNPRAAAAAKVDALVQNGMDEIEIPAFLRKQAD